MSFSSFLDIIINSFNQLLNLLSTFFNSIIENNFVKLIIFIVIIYFIVYLLNKIEEDSNCNPHKEVINDLKMKLILNNLLK